MTSADIRRRYLVLVAMRWLPSGLLVPVIILLMLDRGLTLGQIGLATAAQGVVILLLELPTGGLADALGRRNVLLIASGFELLSVVLLIVADSLFAFAVVFALQGVYRALESGPLAAWYVDAAQQVDPEADIERGLAHAGVAVGGSIATGTLLASGLVALDPLPYVAALVTPLLLALALRLVEVIAIWKLMIDDDRPHRNALGDSLRDVPNVIRSAVETVRRSRMLKILMAVEALWGFGMTSFELLTPAKLNAVVGSVEGAAGIVGPMNTAAWLMSAAGAALVPGLVRRVGAPVSGCCLLALQAVSIVGIGLAVGPVGVVVAFVFTMTTHGAANPVHQGLLHRAVTEPAVRATVLSTNSLAAMAAGAVGAIALGSVADATTLATAMGVGAVTIAAASLLYLLARPRPALEVPVTPPVRSQA